VPDDGHVRSHRRHGEELCSLNGKRAGAQSRHGAATVRGCVVNGIGAGGVNICASGMATPGEECMQASVPSRCPTRSWRWSWCVMHKRQQHGELHVSNRELVPQTKGGVRSYGKGCSRKYSHRLNS
jgi:hypothetical protein